MNEQIPGGSPRRSTRQSIRMMCRCSVVHEHQDLVMYPPQYGMVSDISLGGIKIELLGSGAVAFFIEQKLPLSSCIQLAMLVPEQLDGIGFRCQLRWARQTSQGCELGLQCLPADHGALRKLTTMLQPPRYPSFMQAMFGTAVLLLMLICFGLSWQHLHTTYQNNLLALQIDELKSDLVEKSTSLQQLRENAQHEQTNWQRTLTACEQAASQAQQAALMMAFRYKDHKVNPSKSDVLPTSTDKTDKPDKAATHEPAAAALETPPGFDFSED